MRTKQVGQQQEVSGLREVIHLHDVGLSLRETTAHTPHEGLDAALLCNNKTKQKPLQGTQQKIKKKKKPEEDCSSFFWSQVKYGQSSLFLDSVFVTPRTTLPALLRSHVDVCRAANILRLLTHTFPDEDGQRHTLPSCFSSHTFNKGPFCGVFKIRATFFTFLCFWLVMQCTVEVLSTAPTCKQAVMCLTDDIRVRV